MLSGIADALDSNGIEYMVMGGVAIPVWGIPVSTYDLDIVVDLDPSSIPRMLSILEPAGISFPDAGRSGWLDPLPGGLRQIKGIAFDPDGAFDVDLFTISTPYQRAAFARRLEVELIPGKRMRVITAEDLVLHKLAAGRWKDFGAVAGILALRLPGGLDLAYMRSWADRLGIRERLEKMLRENAEGATGGERLSR